jgi:hypothetical protein
MRYLRVTALTRGTLISGELLLSRGLNPSQNNSFRLKIYDLFNGVASPQSPSSSL